MARSPASRRRAPSWENTARALALALAHRRLRVPNGARGLVILVAVDAKETSAPMVLTGEAKAAPCRPTDGDHAGRVDALPNTACINVLALLPLPRRRASVKLESEQVLR